MCVQNQYYYHNMRMPFIILGSSRGPGEHVAGHSMDVYYFAR